MGDSVEFRLLVRQYGRPADSVEGIEDRCDPDGVNVFRRLVCRIVGSFNGDGRYQPALA
jgi:hypothetical protein